MVELLQRNNVPRASERQRGDDDHLNDHLVTRLQRCEEY